MPIVTMDDKKRGDGNSEEMISGHIWMKLFFIKPLWQVPPLRIPLIRHKWTKYKIESLSNGIIYNIYKKQKIATSAHEKYLNENH